MSSIVLTGDTSGTVTVSAPDVAGTNTITLPAETGTLSLDVSGSNKLINGGFGVNQRAVSGTVSLSAGAFGHDRWKGGASGCSYTFATSANVTTLTISAGSLIQVVEGINLQSGTHKLSWTGTATAKIGGGSLSATGVTGTATGGTNLNIEVSTGTVSLIQLEEGSVATPFEHLTYASNLIECQRYFESLGASVTDYSTSGTQQAQWFFKVEKRASPTMVYSGSSTGTGQDSLSTDVATYYAGANTNARIGGGSTASSEL
tara:strand:- start:1196 stop:1975 length:780 start_codon:yes stop_codon:yes gene_type:complete